MQFRQGFCSVLRGMRVLMHVLVERRPSGEGELGTQEKEGSLISGGYENGHRGSPRGWKGTPGSE